MAVELLTDLPKRRLFTALGLCAGLWLREPLSLSPYSVWLISVPLVFWCAAPFHRGLRRSLRRQRADSDMLISVSILAAFLYTTAASFIPESLPEPVRAPVFGTLAFLVFMPYFGLWLESWLTARSGEAVWKLTRRIPAAARILRAGAAVMVPCSEVGVGARVRVDPGEQVPLDGEVVEGVSRVDESLWTGIADPVEKSAGSRLLGGSVNKSGPLTVTVTGSGPMMALSRVVDSVRRGLEGKTPGFGLADRIAAGYVPAVVMISVVAALFWSWKGLDRRGAQAFAAFCFVLIAATPWAIGFAAPAAIAAGLRRARQLGIRIRNPSVLQHAPRPDVIVVDKTGVLTKGSPELAEVTCFYPWKEEELLQMVLAAGERSGHPYADALQRRLAGKSPALAVDSVETYPGNGVKAMMGGRLVLVGTLPWLEEYYGVEPDEKTVRLFSRRPDPLLAVAVDARLAGILEFNDPLRPEAAEQVRALKDMGIEVVLASGDREATVRHIAAQVGIAAFHAEAIEEEKVAIVTALQAAGKRVAMVGEGFLDAPALSHADLGIAFESGPRDSEGGAVLYKYAPGIDLAAEAADLIVSRRDLGSFLEAIRLTTRIHRLIRENLSWAFVPQVLLLPLAAGAFVSDFGVWFHPSYAAGVGLCSTLVIAVNSFRRLRE